MHRPTGTSSDSDSSTAGRPALDVLRCLVAGEDRGMTRADLAAAGWPTRSVTEPLNALRSRGYVVYESGSERWRATAAGRRRLAARDVADRAHPRV